MGISDDPDNEWQEPKIIVVGGKSKSLTDILQETITTQNKNIIRLKEAFDKLMDFSSHKHHCEYMSKIIEGYDPCEIGDCDCGLSKALQAIEDFADEAGDPTGSSDTSITKGLE